MENKTNYERELAYTNTDNKDDNLIYRTNITFNYFGVGSGISYDNSEVEDIEWF